MTPAVAQIVALVERCGDDPYDEEIGHRFHAEQSAAAAAADGASESLVAAALLHDIGHLLFMDGGADRPGPGVGDWRHESRGARALAPAFPPSVTRPIALHVAAKRYLVATEPAYAEGLSTGSTASLSAQGGAMDTAECARFEGLPGAADALRLRRWDDAAKERDARVPAFADYVGLLERVVVRHDVGLAT